MSDPIAELRRSYEAFNRGDFDSAVTMAHPEIEFARPGGLAPLRGAEALREWMEPDAFEEQQIEALEYRANEDKVLVHQRTRARGAGSGIEIDLESYSVWTFDEEGLCTRLQFFLQHERAEALAAAGLQD